MPFRSQAQQRFAFGTGQPWAKRWAAETDFAKLPKRVKRIRSRMGMKGCTCKAIAEDTTAAPAGAQTRPAAPGKGEQVAPGIRRIRGNLCNVHGKYGPCDKALSKKPKGGKGKKPKAPKAAKPEKAPKQPDTARIQAGMQQDAARAGRAAAAQQRRQDVAASRAASQASRQAALQARNAKRAAAAQGKQPSGGGKTPAAPAVAPVKRTQRLAGRASRGSVPSVGSVGGGAKPKPAAAPKPAAPAAQQPTVAPELATAAQALSAGQPLSDADTQALVRNGLARLVKGELILTQAGQRATRQQPMQATKAQTDEERAMFAKMGSSGGGKGGGGAKLWPKGPSGKRTPQAAAAQARGGKKPKSPKPALTSREKREIGNLEAQRNYINSAPHRANDPMHQASLRRIEARLSELRGKTKAMEAYKAGSPGDYLIVEDRTKPTTWHLQVRTNGKPDHRLMGAAWAALHGGYRGNTYQGPGKGEALSKLRALYASEKMPLPAEKEVSFTVYKDASGADRWVAVSSTAYRDRDREIVSTKALNGAVALADASGFRGPLRFWHVPGVELGDCDYQATAQDGRFLIESGTFRSPALAAAVKSHAGEYQMSIGFTHPPDEPDSNGVFTNIAIFERSLVPRGRASNPLTQFALVTKELRMLTPEKQTELTQLLGGNVELLSGLLGGIVTTDKEQQAAGATFKETETITINGVVYAPVVVKDAEPDPALTEKAGPMMGGMGGGMVEGSPEEEAAEPPDEAAAEGDTGDENMLTPAEISAIAQQTAQVLLDALMPHLGIGQKMDEVKSMLGGMAGSYAKKDAELAEVKETLATVQAQVADLSGEQPRILAGGYRASQAAATITTDEGKLKSAQPATDPIAASFGAFMNDLGVSPLR